MTYPPQQPEDGWNQQQYGQYPADPGQPSEGQAYQEQQAYGQPQYDPATGQPYPQHDQGQYPHNQGQYQYDQGQYPQEQYDQGQYPPAQYNHEEPPTDQTQSLGEGADRTQVIGQQPRPVEDHGQPVPEEPVSYADDEPVQPFAPAHDPAHPYQHQHQPPPHYQAPPEQPYQAPVSVNPASGQPYQPPVSASPASGQPYQAPVSANPASGQPFQQYQQPFPQQQPIYQPNQAPPGVPESPFAAPGPGHPHLPAPVSAQPSSAQPWGGGVVPQFTPKRNRGVPSWVYIVGAVVVVLALALGAVFWFGLPGGEPGGEPTPQASNSPSPEPEVVGGGELLSDEDAGLGFLDLPEPWASTDELETVDGVPGFTSFTGQYVLPVEDGGYIGLIGVGSIDPDVVEYLGTDSLRTAAAELSEVTDAAAWSEAGDVSVGDAEYEYLRIDGRRSILMNYKVSFTADSPPETGATVILAVVDMGDGNAAGFIAHVPDTLAEAHLELVREAVMTLQF